MFGRVFVLVFDLGEQQQSIVVAQYAIDAIIHHLVDLVHFQGPPEPQAGHDVFSHGFGIGIVHSGRCHFPAGVYFIDVGDFSLGDGRRLLSGDGAASFDRCFAPTCWRLSLGRWSDLYTPFHDDRFALLLHGKHIFLSLKNEALQQEIGVFPRPVQTNHMHPYCQLGYRDFSLYDVFAAHWHSRFSQSQDWRDRTIKPWSVFVRHD